MKIKKLMPIIWVVTLSFFLASCGTSNQFASSFGKRKYMKGYFMDSRGSQTAVASNDVAPVTQKTEVSAIPAKSNAVAEKVAENKTTSTSTSAMPNKSASNYVNATWQISKSVKPTVAVSDGKSSINADALLASDNSVTSLTSYRSSDSGGGFFDFRDHPVRIILCILFLVLIIFLIIFLIAAGAPVTVSANP